MGKSKREVVQMKVPRPKLRAPLIKGKTHDHPKKYKRSANRQALRDACRDVARAA